MSKREARIERANAKRLRDNEKAARLKARPAPEKKIRTGVDPNSAFQMTMTWTCDAPDCEGAWSWGQARKWEDETWFAIIEPKLRHFEQLRWSEIESFSSDAGHRMHHNMDTDSICEEAQYRLIELDRYSDVIFRFRLGNRRRLWGFRIVAKFEILWFDPEHRIYPTDPD
jgi:hypothetical protein